MFYEPDKRNHGLPHDPFKALVVPRPIGWISSVDREGRPNLAPYSFFNGVSTDPPCVMFGPSTRPASGAGERALKDSHRNAEHSGEFVLNLATFAQRDAMNASSAGLPAGENEFVAADSVAKHELPTGPLVYGAYSFVWLALLVYVFLLWRRIARVEGELAEVNRKLKGK